MEARFEKKGTEFKVTTKTTTNGPMVTIGAKGESGLAHPMNHPKGGWGYYVYSNRLTRKLTGKGGDVCITHPSAEEAAKWLEQEKKVLADKKKADREKQLQDLREGKNKITVKYHDGEYLSGYEVLGPAAELLEELELARYIDSWGVHVKSELIEALGEFFTYAEAAEFARPALEEKARKKAEREAERQAKFNEAKKTGKRVLVSRTMTPCNDPKHHPAPLYLHVARRRSVHRRTLRHTHFRSCR